MCPKTKRQKLRNVSLDIRALITNAIFTKQMCRFMQSPQKVEMRGKD